MRNPIAPFVSACAASAVAFTVAFSVPVQAASVYKKLTDAQLLEVVAAVKFPVGSHTRVLATTRADQGTMEKICGAVFPAGRVALQLIENPDSGADVAGAFVNQTATVSPTVYANQVRTGKCDSKINRTRMKGLPAGAVALTTGNADIPFRVILARGKVVIVVEERAIPSLVEHVAAAVATYDKLAGA